MILGYIAAALTTMAFVPQVYKVVKTKNTADISLYMYIAFVTGIICWLCYGICIKDFAIIAANSVTTMLAATILTFKIINITRKGEKP